MAGQDTAGSDDPASPGRQLQRWRRQAGFRSAAALANRLGVTQQAVSNWERNRDQPTVEHVRALAELGFDWPSRATEPVRHLEIVPPGDGDRPVGALPAEQAEFMAALVNRVGTGEPIRGEELEFLRNLAAHFGLDL